MKRCTCTKRLLAVLLAVALAFPAFMLPGATVNAFVEFEEATITMHGFTGDTAAPSANVEALVDGNMGTRWRSPDAFNPLAREVREAAPGPYLQFDYGTQLLEFTGFTHYTQYAFWDSLRAARVSFRNQDGQWGGLTDAGEWTTDFTQFQIFEIPNGDGRDATLTSHTAYFAVPVQATGIRFFPLAANQNSRPFINGLVFHFTGEEALRPRAEGAMQYELLPNEVRPMRVRANSHSVADVPGNVLIDAPGSYWHTRWAGGHGFTTGEFPFIIEFDFGQPVALNRVALSNRLGNINGRILAGQVQISPEMDGQWPGGARPVYTGWETVAPIPAFSAEPMQFQTLDIPLGQTVTTRYLRLYITHGVGGHVVLSRFRAFGAALPLAPDALGLIAPTAVRASSSSNLDQPHHVLDPAENHWHSRWEAQGAFPFFLEFDFGEEIVLHEIDLSRRELGEGGSITSGFISVGSGNMFPGGANFLPIGHERWQRVAALPNMNVGEDTQTVRFAAPVVTRFIRLEITDAAEGFASLARFRARGVGGSPEVVPIVHPVPTAARANSAQGAEPAANVLNQETGIWHSTWGAPYQFPYFLEIDFGEAVSLGSVILHPRVGGGANGRFQGGNIAIYTGTSTGWPGGGSFLPINSDDWQVVAALPNLEGGSPEEVEFAEPVYTRFIRMEITSGVGGFASLLYFEARAPMGEFVDFGTPVLPNVARATSFHGQHESHAAGRPNQAINAYPNSHWHTGWVDVTFPVVIEFDFGQEVDWNAVELTRTLVGGNSGNIIAGYLAIPAEEATAWPGGRDILPISSAWQRIAPLPNMHTAASPAVVIPFEETVRTRFMRLEITQGYDNFASLNRIRGFTDNPPGLHGGALAQLVRVAPANARANSFHPSDAPSHILTDSEAHWHSVWSDVEFPVFLEIDMGSVMLLEGVELLRRVGGGNGSIVAGNLAVHDSTAWPGGDEFLPIGGWRRVGALPNMGGANPEIARVMFGQPIATRFIRLEITEGVGDFASLRQFSALVSSDNLSTEIVPVAVRANSYERDDEPDWVLEDNNGHWHSAWDDPGNYPFFLEVDFGDTVTINGVELSRRSEGGRNGNFIAGNIAASGGTVWPGGYNAFLPVGGWTTVAPLPNLDQEETVRVLFDAPVTTRFLRLEITEGFGDYASLRRFTAF